MIDPRDTHITQQHVIPMGDLRDHEPSCDCWCRPAADTECEWVFVHNALDGREKYESGELPLQ